jgi:predicted O-linked N-acetylglucosamine transferase (SPINDLY family)
MFSLIGVCFLLFSTSAYAKPEPQRAKKKEKDVLPQILELACAGDLRKAYNLALPSQQAGAMHTRSELDLIINANLEDACLWHEVAKEIDRKVIPPLAKLYLDGKTCNGLSDIFYISAVSIKKLVEEQLSEKAQYTAHLTMITLLSDSGLYVEAEAHLKRGLALMPHDTSLQIRSALMTPGVFESSYHLTSTRALLRQRLDNLTADEGFTLKGIDEFALSPTFYFVYQGYNDVSFLTDLQNLYARAYPTLSSFFLVNARPVDELGEPVAPTATTAGSEASIPEKRKLRIGFVSSHFRKHSICKLFCGIISGLSSHTTGDGTEFEVVVFSGQDQGREDAYTTKLKGSVSEFVHVNKFTVSARKEVTTRHVDVLIYLDIGMDPSTSVWGGSKLAPVQACVWGHPTTTGMKSMDYFISADLFHSDIDYVAPNVNGVVSAGNGENVCEASECGDYNYTDWYGDTTSAFTEQLVRLPAEALGFTFAKPSLELKQYTPTEADYITRPAGYSDAIAELLSAVSGEAINQSVTTLQDLVTLRNGGAKLVLIPQHLPKFHPLFDKVITAVLQSVPNAYVVITCDAKKALWRRTLQTRWETEGGLPADVVKTRVLWMQNLKPNQYLGMLALGDVMLDPYPFGGGVTTLEGLSVCTPVLTLPGRQTVPALTAGMIKTMLGEVGSAAATELVTRNLLIHKSEESYISSAVEILTNEVTALAIRKVICDNVDTLFDGAATSKRTITEWGNFMVTVHRNNFF